MFVHGCSLAWTSQHDAHREQCHGYSPTSAYSCCLAFISWKRASYLVTQLSSCLHRASHRSVVQPSLLSCPPSMGSAVPWDVPITWPQTCTSNTWLPHPGLLPPIIWPSSWNSIMEVTTQPVFAFLWRLLKLVDRIHFTRYDTYNFCCSGYVYIIK